MLKWLLWAVAFVAASLPAGAQQVVDVGVGDAHGCALYEDGAVWCWGDMPGAGATTPFSAWKVEPLPPARRLAVGRLGACAIDRQGTLWCWGFDLQRSSRSQEPVVSIQPARVEGLPPASDAAIGYSHICAIAEARGTVWCWGENPCGELGCGDVEPRSEPTRVRFVVNALRISAGVSNTCVVVRGGRLSCWGSDNPTMPGLAPFVFDSPEPLIFDEEAIGGLTEVANGRNFACGIRFDGRVTCWGSNILDQLGTTAPRLGEAFGGIGEVEGIDAAEDLDASYFGACAVQSGEVICWGALESGPVSASPLGSVGKATRVGLGTLFSCAVVDGRVLCWGQGDDVLPGMSQTVAVPVPGLPGEREAAPAAPKPGISSGHVNELITRGKFNDALRLIAEAQAETGDATYLRTYEIKAHFEAGYAAAENDDPDTAFEHYSRAIELSGQTHANALNNRAMIFAERGEFEAALADIDLALAARPDAALYHANKCLLLRLTDDLQGALGECDAAIKAVLPRDRGNRAWIFLQRGLTRREAGDTQGSVGDFLDAIGNAKAEAILRIQTLMQAAGLYDGPVDGITSPALDAAVERCVLNDACYEQASAQMTDLIEFME